MEYIFRTTATMKPHNRKRWWIEAGIIPQMRIDAESVREAIQKYREECENSHYITISANAARHPSPMYRDTKNGKAEQIGYVFTASTEFEDDARRGWSRQYIDLWVEIITVAKTYFPEARTA